MKSCVIVLLLGLVYLASTSAIRGGDGFESRTAPVFFRQLLEDPSSVLNASSGKPMEDLQAQILSELDHMKTNTRSYLDQIRALLMNFACRIGLTRFCVTNDLPVVEDLPEVPPFPDDWRSTESPTVKGTDKEPSKPAPAGAAPVKAAESKPEAPKTLDLMMLKADPAPAVAGIQDKPSNPSDIVVIDALPQLQEVPAPTNLPQQSGSNPSDPIKQNLTELDTSIPNLHVWSVFPI